MAIAMRTLSLRARASMRPLERTALGQKLTELRTRYRWSQSGLADESGIAAPTVAAIENGYGQRELDKWKADPTYNPTPYKTHPDTLRTIAYAIASGRPVEEQESVYAELMDAAGYLPRVTTNLRKVETAEEYEQRWAAREEELRRSFEERWEQTSKMFEDMWKPRESA